MARGDDASVDEALLSAVNIAAGMGVFAYNHDHPGALALKTAEYDHQEIHYIVGDLVFPAGVQPAYGLSGGWLAFGSSPDVVRAFAATAPRQAADDGPTFPLLRVSVKAWRA